MEGLAGVSHGGSLRGWLPKAFGDERFAFFGKILSGAQEQRPRWQRGVALVNRMLGDAVGQIYVKQYFPPQAKAEVQSMVANITAAFRKRIDALPWMDPATKAEAQAKLTSLYVGIGYPETWRSYSAYEVKADDFFGNLWRSGLFEYRYSVGRIGLSVDRKEWCMTPQTVNAVNLPLHNGLNFPAAILQPPFFDPQAPPASITARSGRSSVTKSATPLIPRAARLTPKGACEIGGKARTSSISRPPRQSLPRNMIPTNRLPIFP